MPKGKTLLQNVAKEIKKPYVEKRSFLDAPIADFQPQSLSAWVREPGDKPGVYKMTTLREYLTPDDWDLKFLHTPEDRKEWVSDEAEDARRRLLNRTYRRPLVPGHLAGDRLRWEKDYAEAVRAQHPGSYGRKFDQKKYDDAVRWMDEHLHDWKF